MMSMSASAAKEAKKSAPPPPEPAAAPAHPFTNRLVHEASPYLLQHAHNPVDWYPWGEEAFAKAKAESKPVFLSIGYSTCHWCHVMEHESFEDAEVADLLNKHFVSIKVDREERPDIDEVYMTACQLLNSSGGWPLSAFLNTDKKPFFVATYIPKTSKFGRPGMKDLLPRIADMFKLRQDRIIDSCETIVDNIRNMQSLSAGSSVAMNEYSFKRALDVCFRELSMSFDSLGGFGPAPKFPQCHNMMFLLQYSQMHDNDTVSTTGKRMTEVTLDAMRNGGIWDHIGGGFHRYSTDAKWLVPHFEKMLYDQALAMECYAMSSVALGRRDHLDTALAILNYLNTDLALVVHDTSQGFAYHCGEDADSEGVEGKFYVWTKEEIENVLKDSFEHSRIVEFCKAYNIKDKGNWFDEASAEATHSNILHTSSLCTQYNDMLAKLGSVRRLRVRPGLDYKVLCDWNGLAVAGLARVAQALMSYGDDSSMRQADVVVKNMNLVIKWISNNLMTSSYSLKHRWAKGEAAVDGFALDYAAFIYGLLAAYQTTRDITHLELARNLQNVLDREFWDTADGAYFNTSAHGTVLQGVRMKDVQDGAMPSANGIALCNLVQLYGVTDDENYLTKAREMLTKYSELVMTRPSVCSFLCRGLFSLAYGHVTVTIRGESDALTQAFTRTVCCMAAQPRTSVVSVLTPPPGQVGQILAGFSSPTNTGETVGQPTAHICMNRTCQAPTSDPKVLARNLSNVLKKPSDKQVVL